MCTINQDHMMYGSWNMKCAGQSFLSFWTIFCPLTLLTTPKIKIFKKKKNHLEILSFYTCVPQMTIIWCMVPEISSATDRIFLSFWVIFSLCSPNNLENDNFGKEKKTPGDIIILYMCNINDDNHMIYSSWDMKCNRQNFFVIFSYFLLFYRTFSVHIKWMISYY